MRQILLQIPLSWLQVAALAVCAISLLVLVARFRIKHVRNSAAFAAAVAVVVCVALHFVRGKLREENQPEAIPIFGFGMMLFVAFIAANWLAQRRGRLEGIDGDRLMDLGLFMFIGGIIGARVLYIVRNPADFLKNPLTFFKIWEGGIVFYGAVVAATLIFLWYTRRHKLPVWRVLDVAAPAVAFGIGIGRFGCLLNGCCWGKPTNLPWGISFPGRSASLQDGSIPWQDQLRHGLIDEDAPSSLPVHPTQIYLALAGLLLLIVTLWFCAHRRHHGEVMAVLIIGYALSRFLIEFWRDDEPLLADDLTMSQNISLAILVAGFLLWGWLRHQPVIGPTAPAKA